MRVYMLLLWACSVVCDEQTDIEMRRRMVLDHLTTRTVQLEGYHLVSRQIATDVQMFRSYRSVSVVFYPIMRDVSDARFTFQADELHLNNIGSCKPRHVIIKIKRAAYPAVNPDNYDFPKDFISPSARAPIHTVDIYSDGNKNYYSIKNPEPGNWYALIYIQWEDPRTEQVSQQGLVADCSTIVYTDLQVKREENIQFIDCYSELEINYEIIPAYFKCVIVSDSLDLVSFNLTIHNTTNSELVLLRIQASSLPSEDNYLLTCAFAPKENNAQIVTFFPKPGAWHYIRLEPISNGSAYRDCESYYPRTALDENDYNYTATDLMRDDKGRFFTFEYGLPTPDIQDATSLINITANETKSIRFNVNQFIDIGGNLVIEASILMSLKYYMGYRRNLKKGALLAFTEENQFFRVVICLDVGHASIPLENGRCQFNDVQKPALFVLNSTDSETIYDKVIIPYPESGTWYITTKLFCDNTVCPCPTSHNNTTYYVNSVGSDPEEGENFSGELTNSTRDGESNCNASVLLSVSSSSCLGGRCSNHGNCLFNTLGGMVMSFCSCSSGYGGWDCSDSSRMDSKTYMLVSILLLTLSNLLFMVTIYVAIIRLYYTEAMMYTFTMVFSTFYHACDAPRQVAYCIVRGDILQFGDFYCGIMCFWVTLLAMSVMVEKLRSTLQLVGAIFIALLTTWNMHSIISFMVPVIVGGGILLISWALSYKLMRKFKYPKSYYMKHLPAGLVLVSVGLVCFAFLQTEQNYRFVHSMWHGIIALSVVFLLPDVKRGENHNPFLPSSNYCKLPFCNVFSRSQPVTPRPSDHVSRSD